MSTGTHPGAIRFRTFADLVESFRFITATGDIKVIPRNDPLFPAVGVSLGLLGIISEVTIRVVPVFALHRNVRFVSFDSLIDKWEEIQSHKTQCRHLWYPFVDRVQLVIQNRYDPGDSIPSSAFSYAESGWSLSVSQLLINFTSYIRLTPIHRCLQATIVFSKLPEIRRSGQSDRMINVDMNHQSTGFRALNMEVALPFKHSKDI